MNADTTRVLRSGRTIPATTTAPTSMPGSYANAVQTPAGTEEIATSLVQRAGSPPSPTLRVASGEAQRSVPPRMSIPALRSPAMAAEAPVEQVDIRDASDDAVEVSSSEKEDLLEQARPQGSPRSSSVAGRLGHRPIRPMDTVHQEKTRDLGRTQ